MGRQVDRWTVYLMEGFPQTPFRADLAVSKGPAA